MFTDYKFNLYILTSITAHIICASFLLLQNSKIKNVNADISQMVNIVLHQSAKPLASQIRDERPITKTVNKTIAKTASTIVENTSTATTSQNISNDVGQQGRLAKNTEEIYIAELKYDLEKRKKYPVMAKKMGHTGRVTVKFEINRRGEVINSEILEPAKYASLNDSIQKLLLETKNFKPLPDEIKRTTWKFILPVEFKL